MAERHQQQRKAVDNAVQQRLEELKERPCSLAAVR
jgi:hypothetical protein